jgi:alpha-tubulin suppressor-like RCC1 family protein
LAIRGHTAGRDPRRERALAGCSGWRAGCKGPVETPTATVGGEKEPAMNLKHVRSLMLCVLPASLPLLSACGAPAEPSAESADDGEGSVGVAAQAVVTSGSAIQVSSGRVSTLALMSGGTVASWGDNTHGQLGYTTTGPELSPTAVSGLSGVKAVSAGHGNYSLALMADGTVRSWGSNQWGQLGIGDNTSTDDFSTPQTVLALSGITAVWALESRGLALKSDGTVWSWGIFNGSTPVQISGISGITALAAGSGHALALKSDGTVWAWGANSFGQLGLGGGNTTDQSTPVQIPSLSGVTAVGAGWYSSFALRSDGTVWSWGRTNYQTVTCTPLADPTTPAQVSGISGITALAAGEFDTLALKLDGTVWGWGSNNGNELGTRSVECTPVQISGLAGVTAVALGSGQSFARTADGKIWAMGNNSSGQLGDGTTTSPSAPEVVLSP